MIRVSIVGGSGYVGGELIRLLLMHPEVELLQVTSQSNLGLYVYQVHPNLRKQTDLKFTSPEELLKCDVLFLALTHGQSQKEIERYATIATNIIDLSADFRLNSADNYQYWYQKPHQAPDWLPIFVYGLPEMHRQQLRQAQYISGVGCNATASILALLPLVQADLLDTDQNVIIEIKTGSSEGGVKGNPGSHHPERSSVIRTYSAFGHRHTAEVIQELGLSKVSLTMTSVELVRGVLATAHGILKEKVTEKELWQAYRKTARENPFIRVVKERRGVYRVPEPKILTGSNFADIGFYVDENNQHVISLCAIDNLMKGAAGSAVQSMNLMLGFNEKLGLEFPGLHPI
jgi:LysW-gamma-L-alpha-aminoadipyl-6-phosphate/LysW-L-glutamyl-5-phosphate reductase